ncbi:MAG: hypothetical protein O9342_11620 [Beijerinckiaceae bacterium]|nr:hypothetical protein [Beijerinckiaceae bacterium]
MAKRHAACPILLAGWVFLGAGLFSRPALAACEGISNAFAYNECLSKQAPQRGQRAPRVTSGDPEASVMNRRGRHSRRAGPDGGLPGIGGIEMTRRNGRTSAVIDPWSGVRPATPGKRRR